MGVAGLWACDGALHRRRSAVTGRLSLLQYVSLLPDALPAPRSSLATCLTSTFPVQAHSHLGPLGPPFTCFPGLRPREPSVDSSCPHPGCLGPLPGSLSQAPPWCLHSVYLGLCHSEARVLCVGPVPPTPASPRAVLSLCGAVDVGVTMMAMISSGVRLHPCQALLVGQAPGAASALGSPLGSVQPPAAPLPEPQLCVRGTSQMDSCLLCGLGCIVHPLCAPFPLSVGWG